MSCAEPQYIKDVVDYKGNEIPIPCGRCMSCRRDKTRLLELRAKEEWRSHAHSAYVTLTFDDNHLIYKNGFCFPTVNRKVAHEFFDRLRHNIKNLNPIVRMVNRIDENFTFLYSTEYGDDKGRPHIHCILFGVDFSNCRKLLQRTWENGSIDIKPVKNGCIRYVTKYLQKQAFGEEKYSKYFDNGLDAPVVGWSKGFGSKLYEKKADDIRKYGAIKDGNNFLPVPSYYKNKYFFFDEDNIESLEFEKGQRSIKKEHTFRNIGFKPFTQGRYNRYVSELNLFARAISRNETVNISDYGYFLGLRSRI